MVFKIFVVWIQPNLIAPLFNEFKQISNPNIVLELKNLAEKINFSLTKILLMNESSRSAHMNAYFYGLG
jgi:STE24 endopeptidase